MYICDRCHTVQNKCDMRPSGKLKGLSREQSKRHLTCANCKCRTFWVAT